MHPQLWLGSLDIFPFFSKGFPVTVINHMRLHSKCSRYSQAGKRVTVDVPDAKLSKVSKRSSHRWYKTPQQFLIFFSLMLHAVRAVTFALSFPARNSTKTEMFKEMVKAKLMESTRGLNSAIHIIFTCPWNSRVFAGWRLCHHVPKITDKMLVP